MISRLKGILVTRDADGVELETPGGVVYEVDVPITVLQRLPGWLPVMAERLARMAFSRSSFHTGRCRFLTITG